MNEEDIELLEDNGITILCESPFEIEYEDGSQATGVLAYFVLEYIKGLE